MKFIGSKIESIVNDRLMFIFTGLFRVVLRPKRAKQILGNIFLDVKYVGTYLGVPLSNENKREGYTNTTSSEYYVLNNLFSKLSISRNDVMVDVGCGSGRVLGWLTTKYPQNKIMGIEIDPDVAEDTRKRMRKYSKVDIITGNVLDKDIIALLKDQATVDGGGMAQRPLIIYHNCCCLHVFEEDPMWQIERCGDMNGLPTAIVYLCAE